MKNDLQDFFQDLKDRRIISNHANLNNFYLLEKEEKVIYWGIDCTGDSLHLGHLFSLIQIIRFAKEEFKILLVIGGATSKIGDPSDKLKERPQLSIDLLENNYLKIENQLRKLLVESKEINKINFSPLESFFSDNKKLLTSVYQILNLEGDKINLWKDYLHYIWPLRGKNKFQILNNQRWLDKLSFVDFIDQVGRSITINYLLAKETIKQRVNSENGLSFSAFSYSLLQAYDFYYLYKNYNCHGQLGASDQWGNLTTGLKLIHSYYPKNRAFAFTWGLLVDKEGKKISKSVTANQKTIWLDKQRTSLKAAYDFFSNMPDDQVVVYARQFTFLSEEQIQKLLTLNNPPKLRILQRILLELMFYFLYHQEGLEWIKENSKVTCKKNYTQ